MFILKKVTFLLFCGMVFPIMISAQLLTISGNVFSTDENYALEGVLVSSIPNGKTSVTNDQGFFSILVPAGTSMLVFYHFGFQTDTFELEGFTDEFILINLDYILLEEIVVSSSTIQMIRSDSGLIIPISRLNAIPTIGSEPDIFKALTLFPGFSSGIEGTSGVLVRGGIPDQNKVIYGIMPIFNTSHIGGLFTALNPDAIESIEAYKSNFPSKYSGRLSSVIKANLKEGSLTNFHGSAGLGVLTSIFKLEGPFKKNHSSFLFASRASYLGLFNKLRNRENDETKLDYQLYDVSLHTTHMLNEGKLNLTFFAGRDKGSTQYSYMNESFRGPENSYSEKIELGLRNQIYSAEYWRPIGKNSLITFLGGYLINEEKTTIESESTSYLNFDTVVNFQSYELVDKISRTLLAINIETRLNPVVSVTTGIEGTSLFLRKKQSLLETSVESSYNTSVFLLKAYSDFHFTISEHLRFRLGAPLYYYFNNDLPFYGIDPRFSFNWIISENFTLRGDLDFMHQYLQQTGGVNALANQVNWVLASSQLPPQKSWQSSIGTTFNLGESFSFSFDVFYKIMQNQFETLKYFQDFEYDVNRIYDNLYVNGQGKVYGVEHFIQWKYENWVGILGYTLSWNKRIYDDIDGGSAFPHAYDRRHDVSVNLIYKVNNRQTLSVNWVYNTGSAFTIPVGKYYSEAAERFVYVYDTRNNGRLPAYHRADIGFTSSRVKSDKVVRIWQLSIYNLYNRINPSFIQIEQKHNVNESGQYVSSDFEVRKIGRIPIIPGASLKYTF